MGMGMKRNTETCAAASGEGTSEAAAEQTGVILRSSALWSWLLKRVYAIVVVGFLVATVVGANTLYLYITLSPNYGPGAQRTAQISLAFFKFVFNVAVIPALIASAQTAKLSEDAWGRADIICRCREAQVLLLCS